MPWTVIVPMKSLDGAKSRLLGASPTPARHLDLVRAMRADTVAAILGTSARLVVVTPDPSQIDAGIIEAPPVDAGRTGADSEAAVRVVIADPPEPGLNAAVRHAERYAGHRWPHEPVAVVVGDLPALTGAVLDEVLTAAADHPRSAVLDRQQTGTTMLLATPGHRLQPAFGAGSARRHVDSGAHALAAPAAARCDVDVPADLAAATELGLGRHTRAWVLG